jgi:hypothetical protein
VEKLAQEFISTMKKLHLAEAQKMAKSHKVRQIVAQNHNKLAKSSLAKLGSIVCLLYLSLQ